MPDLILPGAEDRTAIVGPSGSGKTVAGAWVLSKQRFDKRPWVALDFKGEPLWNNFNNAQMRPLKLGAMPGKRGFYHLPVDPGQEDELEAWLWNVWRKGNIGIFADEASLIPQRKAFKAILRQGRSKRIPVIACTQRPVDVEREMFSESGYKMVFPLSDKRDYVTVKGFVGDRPIEKPILDIGGNIVRHASYWFDEKRHAFFTLRPVPKPDDIVAELKRVIPVRNFFGD